MTYLVDTDVLIDALRGNESAIHFIRQNREHIKISVLTIAELYAGVRNRQEKRVLEELLTLFSKIGIDEEIAQKGGAYRNLYGKSHNTGLIDALLAATSEKENSTLVTLNKKHYPMLDHVKVPYKKT